MLEYNTGPAKKPDGGGAEASAAAAEEEDEVDPLDAFMMGVQEEVKADKGKTISKQQVRPLHVCVACRLRRVGLVW